MMYISQGRLPNQATARLKKAAYSRNAGEEVAHEVNGDTVTVTFLTTAFTGGISRHTITLAKFKQDFAVILKERAGD